MKNKNYELALLDMVITRLIGTEWTTVYPYILRKINLFKNFSDVLKDICKDFIKMNQNESNQNIAGEFEKMKLIAKMKADEWEKDGIFSITFDDFPQIPALQNLKDVFWLFLKGNKTLLNKKDSIVAVVGEDSITPTDKEWLEKNISKEKIIISTFLTKTNHYALELAAKNKQKSILFIGIDLHINRLEKSIQAYIENIGKTGLLISEIIPWSNKSGMISEDKRSQVLSLISSKSYISNFKNICPTLTYMMEAYKNNNQLITQREVIQSNEEFFKFHPNTHEMIKKIIVND